MAAFISPKPVLTAVSSFDLARYLGTWYEIARMPASFEKNMTNVTAMYSLKGNGMVRVENAGVKNGKRKTAVGKAKFAGAPTTGHLRVSFFGPFYADYTVIALDTAYRYAMVVSSKKYLWVLCREPTLDEGVLRQLLDQAKALGFDISRLYYTPQHSNAL